METLERDDLDSTLRKYKLDDTLLLLALESQKMLKEETAIKEIIWQHSLGSFVETKKQFMPIWGLADISYRAIKNSNDHRQGVPTYNDICTFNNLLAKVTDEKAKKQNINKDSAKSKLNILLGLSQKQFWWQ